MYDLYAIFRDIRGESTTLGRRMPWANCLFSKKYERKNVKFFT